MSAASPADARRWPRALRALGEPYVVLPAFNLVASAVYLSRDAMWRDRPAWGELATAGSLLASAIGCGALIYILLLIAPRRRWVRWGLAGGLAGVEAWVHLLQFGYAIEFDSLVTASVFDFARQHPDYSLTMIRENVTPLRVVVLLTLWLALATYIARALGRARAARPPRLRRRVVIAALVLVDLWLLAWSPFLVLDHYVAHTLRTSLAGAGRVNMPFEPERLAPPVRPVDAPPNLVLFRLEEITRDTTQVYGSAIPNMPFWTRLIADRPAETFVARRHLTNSSATDVSVMLMYTGAASEAPLSRHRRLPMLWSYARAGGYDTSAFLPYRLTWGDFATRFQTRPGVIELDRLVHAGNADRELVYDASVNDRDLVELALSHLRGRAWRGPFFQIVSLKMPHHLGVGATVNDLHALDPVLPADMSRKLKAYHNAIHHDDGLMREYLAALPDAVRANTIVVVVADHGASIYRRAPRLENYFHETAEVPFWILIPEAVQRRLGAPALTMLRRNFANRTTSNQDLLPTILDLLRLSGQPEMAGLMRELAGTPLMQRKAPADWVVMLNTNVLRHWVREGFGVTTDNGRRRYVYNMGREQYFDLTQDPGERQDLSADPVHAASLAAIRRRVMTSPYLLRIVNRYGGWSGGTRTARR